MLVLHVITTTRVGGAETQLTRLIGAKECRAGHLLVGLEPEGPMAARMREAGARVISLGLRPGAGALASGTAKLAGLIRRHQPKVVQGWMYHANLLAAIASRLAGSPPVIWGLRCTDMDLAHYSRSSRLVFGACRRLARLPRAIVANSQAGLEFHQGLGYPADRMSVIPNGFDTGRFRPDPQARQEARAELGWDDSHLVAGMVARLDPMKDFGSLLKAMSLTAQKLPQARFLLLGQDVTPQNPALKAVLEPPLAGRCQLLGRREDVPRWLAAMDLHLLSSAFGEGLSNALGEAMACGLPCAATMVGDAERLIKDCGRVVPPGRPEELAGAMLELLGLPKKERLAMGARARQRIQAEFSIPAMAAAFDSLYEGLISG